MYNQRVDAKEKDIQTSIDDIFRRTNRITMLIITLFLSLFALPTAHHTEFLRRISTPDRPQILVLISPGWEEQMVYPLLEHLWMEGFSVWSLRFAQHAQDLEQMSQSLEKALDSHTDPIVLAHGLSSIVLLHAISKTKSKIRGLAFLGAPIKPLCSPDLKDALIKHTWKEFSDFPIQRASPTFHQLVHQWCIGDSIAGEVLGIQYVWSATTNTNPIAPPESIRPHLSSQHRFVRSGPLALHGKEPRANELVMHKPTLEDLSLWLWNNKPWHTP